MVCPRPRSLPHPGLEGDYDCSRAYKAFEPHFRFSGNRDSKSVSVHLVNRTSRTGRSPSAPKALSMDCTVCKVCLKRVIASLARRTSGEEHALASFAAIICSNLFQLFAIVAGTAEGTSSKGTETDHPKWKLRVLSVADCTSFGDSKIQQHAGPLGGQGSTPSSWDWGGSALEHVRLLHAQALAVAVLYFKEASIRKGRVYVYGMLCRAYSSEVTTHTCAAKCFPSAAARTARRRPAPRARQPDPARPARPPTPPGPPTLTLCFSLANNTMREYAVVSSATSAWKDYKVPKAASKAGSPAATPKANLGKLCFDRLFLGCIISWVRRLFQLLQNKIFPSRSTRMPGCSVLPADARGVEKTEKLAKATTPRSAASRGDAWDCNCYRNLRL